MFSDYDFYKTEYGGSAIAEASFTLYGNRATAYLKSIMSTVPDPATDDMKMAMCAVVDEMGKYDSEHGGIQSESVGSWSRSYKGISKSLSRRCSDATELFLGDSGLLTGRWL